MHDTGIVISKSKCVRESTPLQLTSIGPNIDVIIPVWSIVFMVEPNDMPKFVCNRWDRNTPWTKGNSLRFILQEVQMANKRVATGIREKFHHNTKQLSSAGFARCPLSYTCNFQPKSSTIILEECVVLVYSGNIGQGAEEDVIFA